MNTTVSVLPGELYNHVLSFRPVHPVAKLIQDLKQKFNLCVVCMEQPRHNDLECCSSTCHHQMNDGPWFDYPTFDGQNFDRYVNEKYVDGKWLDDIEKESEEYWYNGF